MSYIVGHKGQVVIAKEIREHLGIGPGWLALQRRVGDHVELYFVAPEHRNSLKGSLAKHLKGRISPGHEWDQAREAAWSEAAADKMGPEAQEP